MAKQQKPTDLEQTEVLQYVVTKNEENEYRLKTDAKVEGMAEVEIDAMEGDNIALADATTGEKVNVIGNQLAVTDSNVQTSLANLEAATVQVLRPFVDYDSVTMALSVGNTVETYIYTQGGTTKYTATVTFTDSTRTVWTSLVWS